MVVGLRHRVSQYLSASAEQLDRISLKGAAVAFSGVYLVYLLIALMNLDPALKTVISDIGDIVANGIAASCLLYAAVRSEPGSRSRTVWFVFFCAQLSWTLGSIIWSIIELGFHQNPFPSISDVPILLFYLLFAAGIVLLPADRLSKGERLKMMLDTAIVVVASSLIFWAILIAPTIESGIESDALTKLFSVAYPVMDLVLLFVLFDLLLRRLRSLGNVTIFLLAADVVLLLTTDVVFMSQALDGTYVAGGLLDTGWVLSYLFGGLAGISQVRSGKSELLERLRQPSGQPAWPRYIPYISAAVVYALLVWSHNHDLPVGFFWLSVGVGGILGMVVVRQIVALNENARLYASTVQEVSERRRAEDEVRKLNEGLERRVQERTSQLELANLSLQREIAERRLAEETVKRLNDDLERRVQERTSQLELANSNLQREIVERKIAEEAVRRLNDDLEHRVQERTSQLELANLSLQKEIVERKLAEKKIAATLREKEVLLREIYHRVKNNLQMVSSLLSLQSNELEDEEARSSFKESQDRIRSMAMVHERLYGSGSLASIAFTEYIPSLTAYLFRSYSVGQDRVRLVTDVDDISVGIDTAIPCGLIINELLSNSLKYAFPGGRSGEVHIDLKRAGDSEFLLVIGDNGVGLPDGLDLKSTETLGMRLVVSLVRQLQGEMEIDSSNGTRFDIRFRELKYRDRVIEAKSEDIAGS
jgi:two-component sensor histidine kinase